MDTRKHSIAHRALRTVVSLAMLAAIPVLATPASAQEAIPSTTTLWLSYDAADMEAFARVAVATADVEPPSGVVVLSEAGQELGRAVLAQGGASGQAYATSYLRLPPGPHTIDVTYLGDGTIGSSSATGTLSVPPPVVDDHMIASGTVRVGNLEAPMGPNGRFGTASTSHYEPLTGVLRPGIVLDLAELTRDVPGVGVVTVVVQPHLYLVDPWITATGEVRSRDSSVGLRVRHVVVDGVSWAASCGPRVPRVPATGMTTADGLVVTVEGTTALTPVDVDSCGGRGDLVNSVLAGPVRLTFTVTGTYPPPPPPDTPTTTDLELSDVAPEVFGLTTATVHVATTTGHEPHGSVAIRENGILRVTVPLPVGAGGAVTVPLVLGEVGQRIVTAEYLGLRHPFDPTVMVFAPSGDAVAVAVEAGPTGWGVTGAFAIGGAEAALPVGSLLTDVVHDGSTGHLSGRLWIPAGEIVSSVVVEMKGELFDFPATIRYGIVPDGDLVVAIEDGRVVVEPLRVRVVVFWVDSSPTGLLADTCVFEPVDLELTGSVDATGLHLRSSATSIPFPTASWCGVQHALVEPGFSLRVDVPLAEAQPDVATTTDVVTWFPAVAQFDNTFVVATVRGARGGAVPVGSVEFRDGDRVLGTVPLDANGRATLIAPMVTAGARTVTAELEPGTGFAPSAGTTTVTVVGLTGRALSGTFTIGGTTLDVEPGSVLNTSTDPGGAGVMLAPTVVDLVIGSTAVQAEVRLIRIFDLGAVAVAADGTVTDFEGAFLLHVRSVTTPAGTVFPTWCVNGVVVRTVGDDLMVSAHRAPMPQCTGIGDLVAAELLGEGVAELVVATS